jgi:hypothetical protein
MKRLIYTSTVSPRLQLSDLMDVMRQARVANQRHQISGILIFSSRFFAQWLEGEKREVDQLFANICIDPRHFNCIKREEVDISVRRWSGWAMSLGLIIGSDIWSTGADHSQRVNFHEESNNLEQLHQRFYEAAAQLPSLNV